jgi:outer membrane lipoprotein-sorting protein
VLTNLFRASALAVLILVRASLAGEPAKDPALAAMLRDLGAKSAKVKTVRAHFEQTKRIAIVRDELRSAGTFLLDKGGRIVWDVREPEAARIVIRKDGVFANGKQVVGGEGAPAGFSPLPMLESLNGIFAGLSEETTQTFEVTRLAKDRLRLIPLAGAVRTWLESIEIELDAAHGTPTRIRLLEPGGDTTEVVLTEVALNPALPDSAFAP